MTLQPDLSSEQVLDGRLIVNVRRGRRIHPFYEGPLVDIGSIRNGAGSMRLTPLELAALLDGPLERALETANKESESGR